MGLDLFAFVVAVENAFDIRIPEEDMPDITTPRKLINYVAASLSAATSGVCASQRAFYRLRSSLTKRIGCRRTAIQLNTSLFELIPPGEREEIWDEVRQDVGLAKANRWPRLAEKGWFDWLGRPRVSTLREAVLAIASHPEFSSRRVSNLHRENISAVVHGNKRYAGWTREQIAAIVHRLMLDDLGINTSVENVDDMTWQEDMGIY